MSPERHERLRKRANSVQDRKINLRNILRSENHSTVEKGKAFVEILPVNALLRYFDWRDQGATRMELASKQLAEDLKRKRDARPGMYRQQGSFVGENLDIRSPEDAVLDSLREIADSEGARIEQETRLNPDKPDEA